MYKRQVLEHPLLEVGRSFIFNDALPYIEDMVTEDDLAEMCIRDRCARSLKEVSSDGG